MHALLHKVYMHVKYPLNRENRFVKTVNTKKNCINFQLAIRILKNRSIQTCITRPPIFGRNLRAIGLLLIGQPRFKDIWQTTDRHLE